VRRLWCLTVAVVMATACGADESAAPGSTGSDLTSSTAAPPVRLSVPTTASFEFSTQDCGGAVPRAWTLLCEAAEVIAGHHLATPDPVGLAAAALLGVESASFDQGRPSDDPLRCVLPHVAFATLCEPILKGAAAGIGSLEERVEAAVQGMFRYGLDPFSSYIEPDLADRLDELGSGILPTLGMAASVRNEDGGACGPISSPCLLRVSGVFPFGVAEGAGVVVGDVIVSIDGRSLAGLSPDEALALLYGFPGTSVNLELVRNDRVFAKALVHQDIRLDPIEFEELAAGILYLRLNEFSQESAQLLGRALETEAAASSRGLILDLRSNPGGLLQAAQAVASQFLDSGVVLVEMGREGDTTWPVIQGGLAPGIPLVVLTDRSSASAAEVVAAALQEAARATVVGDRTFGKNTIQLVITARNGGQFRVTTSRWTTPGGIDVGVRGLTPDIVITEPANAEDDPALVRAFALLGE
jgi:carboxyl-terminal processing protease